MPTVDEIIEFRGQDVFDRNSEKLGKVQEIFLDGETEQPEWLLVHTGFFGGKGAFVPVASASTESGQLTVPFDKAQVKDAPHMAADGALSQEEEQTLYSHYGLDYGESQSNTGLPEEQPDWNGQNGGAPREAAGEDVSGPTTDEAMTRSEEELHVGTAQREAGRARLRKHVVTEQVETTVPVQHEEVRVEREPITDANLDAATSGAQITSEEHEIVLHEEEVVAEKRVVPKERVRLDKETVTEDRQVSEEIQKEQIETPEGR